jgi:C4-dicarboxylate-specific signal transduction histidine kinase
MIAFVKTQGARAKEIIRGLSRFSSQQPGKVGRVDLREVVSDVLRFVAAGNEYAGVAIDVDAGAALKVSANQIELEQVALNLVVNALQAVSGPGVHDGRVEIRIVNEGDQVRLEVEDNGHGVKPEDEPKLFQPFFTTKPVGKGTGLGLSVSYGIIRALGGTLGYRRNPDRGATFYFDLPAVDVAQPAHT